MGDCKVNIMFLDIVNLNRVFHLHKSSRYHNIIRNKYDTDIWTRAGSHFVNEI